MVGDTRGSARLRRADSAARLVLGTAVAVSLHGRAVSGPAGDALAQLGPGTVQEDVRPPLRPRSPLQTLEPGLDVRAWTTEDGLPQNSVTCIAQTADGYLWLGTYGGLVRFDGVEFETYSIANVPELPENRIKSLCVGTSGDVWIGTQSLGVLRHGAEGFEQVLTADGACVGPVWMMIADREGEVLAMSRDVLRLHGRAFSPIPEVPDWPHVLLEGSAGELWIGHGAGLVRLDAEGSRSVLESHVTALALDADGRLVVGMHTGELVRVEQDGLVRELTRFSGSVSDVLVDRDGAVWAIASDGLHLSSTPRSDDDTPRFGAEPVLPGSFHCLASDREGDVWIGAVTDGLVRVRRRDLAHLVLGTTHSPASDPEGALWCIAQDHVCRVQAPRVEQLEFPGEANPFPLSLLVDRVGSLWIGTEKHGLFRYDGREVSLADPAAIEVRTLCERSDGSLWMSQDDLVGSRVDGGFVPFARAPAPVRVLMEAAAGGLWVGTLAGAWHLADDATWTPLDPSAERPLPVRALHEDERGTLWVGTYGLGLVRYAPGEVPVRFDRSNGLPDDAILALLPEDDGDLWINGNRGPFHVRRAALEDFVAGRAHVVRCDQLPGIEGNGTSAGLRDDQGRYWFATVRGLSMLDPERPAFTPVPPGIVIRRCVVDGVDYGTRAVTAPPGPGEIEVHFAGISFEDPSAVTYRYMLESYDRSWTDGGAQRTVRYSKVPPGDYVFRVQARSGRGVWSETDASLALELRPALYQTRRFLAAVVALAIATVWGAHRWRLRTIAARNRDLEERIAHRTRELRTANHELEAFTYTVSHDLRAPLRHISYYASRVRNDLEQGVTGRTEGDLQGITRSTRRMSRLIDDLLTLSRLGRKEVVRMRVDSAVLVQDVWAEVERAAGGGRAMFEAGDLPPVHADEKLLRHVWLNLLDNARKYSANEPEPRVRVTSEAVDGRTWFRVDDNGVGFDQRYASKLFVPFERLHSEEEFHGTGVGLAIAARMVEKHGGVIRGEGRLGEGATFEFSLDPA